MSRIVNIRSKMAVLIVALVLIIGAAIVQAISILASIERRLAALDDQTSAALAANAVVATSDEALAEAISKARLVTDERALGELTEDFARILGTTTRSLDLLPIEPGSELRLTSQLDLFASRMERLFEARRATLDTERALDDAHAELALLADVVDAELSLLIAAQFDLDDDALTREQILSRSAAMVRLQGQADLLRSRITDLAITTGQGRRQMLQELRIRLGDLVRAATAIGTGGQNRRAGVALLAVHEMIAPEGAMSRAIDAADEANVRFSSALSDVNEARRAADRLTAETAEAVGASILQRRRAVFSEEGGSRRVQVVMFSIVVLSILLLVWWVTDRRIVRRIERLTCDMQRVAAGDLDAPVRSEGDDEIGQMAAALAVFRVNAMELRRSNAELGNFAYAASHDLRSPLRAIRNLVDWTIEDAGDELPDDVKANLDMIRTRADRLSRLLTDLLEYARAGSGERRYEVVHLPGLVRDIAEMVDPDRRFEITFTGDRCVTSVKTPLRTILLNLVSNAIKHHDRGSGRVVVSHGERDGRTVITVADDGPGVPEQYQQKVFELFQTLKPSDEVEGSGMGLAMVRKLVSELGGDIVLRSLEESDRGATFIITLPVHDSSGIEDRPVDEGEEGKAA